jgi:hypothetical protein
MTTDAATICVTGYANSVVDGKNAPAGLLSHWGARGRETFFARREMDRAMIKFNIRKRSS